MRAVFQLILATSFFIAKDMHFFNYCILDQFSVRVNMVIFGVNFRAQDFLAPDSMTKDLYLHTRVFSHIFFMCCVKYGTVSCVHI